MFLILFLQLFMRFLAILVTAVIPNPYLIILFALMLPLLLGFRYYYITTAREVKRLEALGKLSCAAQ